MWYTEVLDSINIQWSPSYACTLQITVPTGLLDIEKDTVSMPDKKNEGFGSVLQSVPVIIVGSHYDLVPANRQQEAISAIQSLVNEMKVKYVCIL